LSSSLLLLVLTAFTTSTACIRLRIDCEATTEPAPPGGPSEKESPSNRPQGGFHGGTEIPNTTRQSQVEATKGFGSAPSISNGGPPSTQDILNLVAFKYLQTVDPSKLEDLNGFVYYMEKVRNVLIVDAQPGSLIITVKCPSLEILEELWNDYCTGRLNETAQKFLVTAEILMALGLRAVKLTTTILDEEYRACREYFVQRLGEFKGLVNKGQTIISFRVRGEVGRTIFLGMKFIFLTFRLCTIFW